ncbi:MAG TPA: glycosyltransferase family A protein [Gaiellaceae bacterium]|nr:glycosyltransferase family A protein [Gaiellaceae bacterium]
MGALPLVSAIVSAFQAEAFLEDAIASILAQDYAPFEVVVCDDGSTDRTPRILDEHPELRKIRQPNAGPAAARNAAAAVSHGELLAVFDADDLWPPTRLAVQAGYLAANPDVGCVLGHQEWIEPPPWGIRDAVYDDLDGIPFNSLIVRRNVFEEVGGYDESFTHGEDRDFLFRLRERGVPIEVIPEIVVFRRFHGANLTLSAPSTSPMLRALHEKLERERATRKGSR